MNDRIYYSRDAESQAMRERTTAILAFLVIGMAVGTALALLFAPRSGEKTRAELSGALDHSFDEGRKASGDAIERLEKDFADLRKRIESR
ncbi:MAG: YtxH domain-containing protein [Chloroflexota bacterium]